MAVLLLASGCAHPPSKSNKQPVASPELWIPVSDGDRLDLQVEVQGRELWIDVELSGYTRQALESFSDYEAAHEDPLPSPTSSEPR